VAVPRSTSPPAEVIGHVRSVLEAADEPIRRRALLRALREGGHSTTRRHLKAALMFLDNMGMVAEGSKGVVWVPEMSDALREAVEKGRSL